MSIFSIFHLVVLLIFVVLAIAHSKEVHSHAKSSSHSDISKSRRIERELTDHTVNKDANFEEIPVSYKDIHSQLLIQSSALSTDDQLAAIANSIQINSDALSVLKKQSIQIFRVVFTLLAFLIFTLCVAIYIAAVEVYKEWITAAAEHEKKASGKSSTDSGKSDGMNDFVKV